MKHLFLTIEKVVKKKATLICFILLGLIVLGSSWSLLIPGLGTGHDLNHPARIFEMVRGLKEGIFPVIWSGNLGFGFGMPLFEFYAPLPYFIGALWNILGFSLDSSVKLMMLVGHLITLLAAYYLGKELWKNNWAGVLTAALIMLAPYRAVDMYIRTAVSEGWAIGFLVTTMLGIAQVVNKKSSGWIILSLGFAGLVLSHNLTALMSAPFLALFGLGYIFIQEKVWSQRLQLSLKLLLLGVLGVALAAWYVIPVFAEKDFTQVDKYTLSSYYDFKQHFLYIRQLFEPWGEWEYGGSGWGPDDEMSFFLGFGQLFAVAGAILAVPLVFISKGKKKVSTIFLHLLLLVLFFVALLLTLTKAQPIWELIPVMEYFQFPWRFLSISLIFGGLIASSTLVLLPKKLGIFFFCSVIVLLLAFNPRYFRSEKYRDHSHDYIEYSTYIQNQTSTNLFDYVPKDVVFLKQTNFFVGPDTKYSKLSIPPTSIVQLPKELVVSDFQTNTSTKKIFSTTATESAAVSLSIAYYPGWQILVDGTEVESGADQYGLLSFSVPAGTHEITAKLGNTPARYWSKIVSLCSLFVLLLLAVLQHNKKNTH